MKRHWIEQEMDDIETNKNLLASFWPLDMAARAVVFGGIQWKLGQAGR